MEIALRDLLFINYAVPPDRVRRLVPAPFDLDIRTSASGGASAFVSAVVFKVAEIRSTSVALPGVTFNQINYRAYIASGEGPAVYFLDLKVGSRLVAALSSFLRLPIAYEEIELSATRPPGQSNGSLHCVVESEGIRAKVSLGIGEDPSSHSVPLEFLTERPIGFIKSSTGEVYRIEVGHARLNATETRVDWARSPLLESLGVLDACESGQPDSVLYVGEALFEAATPKKVDG